jgi:hypothetical protein
MWNLDRVHKIGEFIAAIAVVISLIFVGIEVKQNNSIQIQQATQNLSRDWSDVVAAYQDPNLACLFIRLGNDRANLTAQEATQIEAVIWRIYKVYEQLHYQNVQGMVDASVWNGFKRLIMIEASYETFRVWWGGYQATFSPRFREFLDELMAEIPVNTEAYFLNMECDTPVGEDYWRAYDREPEQ